MHFSAQMRLRMSDFLSFPCSFRLIRATPGRHCHRIVAGRTPGRDGPGRDRRFEQTGVELVMESGAGGPRGFPDSEYTAKGVRIATREEVFAAAEVLLQVRGPGANPETGAQDLARMRAARPSSASANRSPRSMPPAPSPQRGVTFLAMELMPRITRAQSMDALSSMATIAGYKAVLIAADSLPRMFPMLMTAAGTVAPRACW